MLYEIIKENINKIRRKEIKKIDVIKGILLSSLLIADLASMKYCSRIPTIQPDSPLLSVRYVSEKEHENLKKRIDESKRDYEQLMEKYRATHKIAEVTK